MRNARGIDFLHDPPQPHAVRDRLRAQPRREFYLARTGRAHEASVLRSEDGLYQAVCDDIGCGWMGRFWSRPANAEDEAAEHFSATIAPDDTGHFRVGDRVMIARVLDDVTSPELIGKWGSVVEVDWCAGGQVNYEVSLDTVVRPGGRSQVVYVNEQMLSTVEAIRQRLRPEAHRTELADSLGDGTFVSECRCGWRTERCTARDQAEYLARNHEVAMESFR